MKLLILFPSESRGGAEEYALIIAEAAIQQGWEVSAAFSQVDGTASLKRDFLARGIQVFSLKICEPEQPLSKVQDLVRAIRTTFFLLQHKPDVVKIVLPSPGHAFGSIIACGLLKIPTAIVFQLSAKVTFTHKSLRVYAWARHRNQQWITISENGRKLISESFHAQPDELLYIYNGANLTPSVIDTENTRIQHLRQQLRSELGLPHSTRLALTVGRLDFQKGHEYLIEAIPYLTQENPELRFIWAGDGSLRQALEKKLCQYGIQDKVFILGYRSDIPDLLKASDLFIFPTRFEGLPFALLEAMANGLPVISSDANGIPEVIANRVHGLLFKTGDSDDLLKAVQWALKHPEKMAEMAGQAKIRVKDFSEDKMVSQTLSALKNAVKLQKK
jgi:glycosyltransferase involved in cell wall biosynthesis